MTARSSKLVEVPRAEEIEIDETTGEYVDKDKEKPTISVELAFEHQLCEVQLAAWSKNEKYAFEIAGVRLGNPNIEGRFRYKTLKNGSGSGPAYVGTWDAADNICGNVEYIYRPGDKLVSLNSTTFNNNKQVAPIMGKGGYAMVIPTNKKKWDGRKDNNITKVPYTTDQSYFSVLLRVSHRKYTSKTVYPYPAHSNENIHGKMVVVYLAVKNDTGEVISRVYPGENENEYFTDERKTERYTLPDGVVVKDFGWAAIPVDINWEAGKKYDYKLNYTNGIGLHDPDDPEPGTPIVDQNTVPVTVDVEVTPWGNYEEIPVKVIPDNE